MPRTRTTLVAGTTEYMEEFCGKGTRMFKGVEKPFKGIPVCYKTEIAQPVGGRVQAAARARSQAITKGFAERDASIYDSDFVSTVYKDADMAHHRVEPGWRNPKWTPLNHPTNLGAYKPSDRDPPNRNQFMMYQPTSFNPLDTPAHPLPVPDVHKLRYMNNSYMTSDDWY